MFFRIVRRNVNKGEQCAEITITCLIQGIDFKFASQNDPVIVKLYASVAARSGRFNNLSLFLSFHHHQGTS